MTGPDGEPLCIDVAIVGSLESGKVLFQLVEFMALRVIPVVPFNWL